MLAPALFLVLGHAAAHVWRSNEIAIQLANRGLGYAGLIALFPVAVAIVALAQRFPGGGRVGDLRVVAALAFAATIVLALPGRHHSGVDDARQLPAAVPAMTEAAAVLNRLVPPSARFATERNFPDEIAATGVSHPDFWLPRMSKRNTLNVFNLESSSVHDVVFGGDSLGHLPPVASADELARIGVTHVVTVTPDTAFRLAESGRFTLLWQSPPLAVLAVAPIAGHPAPASQLATEDPASARLERGSAEHLTIVTDAPAATAASAAVAWSPKWHLRIDGRSVPLHRDQHNLLAFTVPAGHHLLDLGYHADGWDRLGLLISLVVGGGLAGTAAARWRRRRRPHDDDAAYRSRRSPFSSSRMSRSLSRTA